MKTLTFKTGSFMYATPDSLQPCPPVSLHSLATPTLSLSRSIDLVLSYDPGHVTSAVGVTPVLEPSLEAWWGP